MSEIVKWKCDGCGVVRDAPKNRPDHSGRTSKGWSVGWQGRVHYATRIWYNDVDKAVRQMMNEGEIEVVGRGGVWGGAEVVALRRD